MNAIAGFVGPISLDTFLIIYVAWVVMFIALVVWTITMTHNFFKKRKARRNAEAVREAEALIGADATPSLMYSRQVDDEGSISGLFRILCLNGGVADVVEDLCHDLKCEHPCADHPECQLAH